MLRQGDRLGPYTLVEPLGRGAFGAVWLAEKATAIATPRVALKIPLHADVPLDDLRREAALWVQAGGHPNVLPLVDADIHDGVVVIASEYAPSGSLRDWLAQQGGVAPTIATAVEMIGGILAGLEHLHARRILHRDLKPANILLQGQTPRLADFGLARLLGPDSASSSVSGTPHYMAPEAFSGARTEQTDLWSAAVILQELLTGGRPFRGGDLYELMRAVREDAPAPLPDTVPAPIRQVVVRGLARDPVARYPSASAMLADLRPIREEIRAVGAADVRPIEGGDLGHGVRIGGTYYGEPLGVVAGNWVNYYDAGWVRSGWLYTPERSANFAELFFKIHLFHDGTGYIHLLSSANPWQTIWLETDADERQEDLFAWSYGDIPRATVWRFRWRATAESTRMPDATDSETTEFR